MVVAIVALIASLSGSAYAAAGDHRQESIQNGTVTTRDIRNHSLSGTDMPSWTASAAQHQGVALGPVPQPTWRAELAASRSSTPTGQAVRGRGLKLGRPHVRGSHQVIFNADVRSCAYFATIGDPSAAAPPSHS